MFKRIGFPTIYRDGEGSGGGGGNPPAPWYQGVTGINDEIVGHLQAKGWDKMDPKDVAVAATISHRSAQALIGAPQEELFRIPKNNDAAAIGKVLARLGRPEKEDGYDFSEIKFKDGTTLGDKFTNSMRKAAFGAGLSADGAKQVVKTVLDHIQGESDAELAEATTKLQDAKNALAKQWGVPVDRINASAQFEQAKTAVRKLGWDENIVNALESIAGYDKVMDALALLGSRMGEDVWRTGNNAAGDTRTMSVDQANARKGELMRDQEWIKRYNAGDTEARKEMLDLNRIISAAAPATPVW